MEEHAIVFSMETHAQGALNGSLFRLIISGNKSIRLKVATGAGDRSHFAGTQGIRPEKGTLVAGEGRPPPGFGLLPPQAGPASDMVQ